jgi:hypothetical protein
MINVLKIPKHGIKTITTHMDFVSPSKKVEAMDQMLADRGPIVVRIATELLVVFHLSSHPLIVVVDKRFAMIESGKLVREVMWAFFVKPAASKRVIGASAGLSLGGGISA